MKASTWWLAVAFVFGARGEARSEPAPKEIARQWLNAVGSGGAEAVGQLTAVPFTYREGWPGKQCERIARRKDDLAAWVKCVREKEDFLIKGIAGADPPLEFEAGISQASKKAQRLARRIKTQGEWVYVFVDADGIRYYVLMLVTAKGVAACVIDNEFDSG